MAHSRSFLANQKARNAIVGGEHLLNAVIQSMSGAHWSMYIVCGSYLKSKDWLRNTFFGKTWSHVAGVDVFLFLSGNALPEIALSGICQK